MPRKARSAAAKAAEARATAEPSASPGLLLVGLGNPGRRYAPTRHNLGFRVLDVVARGHATEPWREAFEAEVATADLDGRPSLLLKPMTFMNDSGRAVRAVCEAEALPHDSVCVVHDEVDLPLGQMRLKLGGGDAGHRGLASIRDQLGSGDYLRLRLGVGRPPAEFDGTLADFLLEGFPPVEHPAVRSMLARAVDAVIALAVNGASAAMNIVNQRTKQ